MTTVLNRRGIKDRLARAAALGLLAVAAAVCSAPEARAQWVTSGTNTTTTNNVGIGTATPSQMFHVHSAGAWAGTRVTTAATGATINDGVHFGYDDGYGAYVWNREATPVILSTSNAERMRISASGNVGIGTSAPAAKLDVNGSASFSGSTTVAGRGTFALDGGNNLNFSMYNSFRVSAASLLVNGALETYDNHFAMRQTSNNTLTVRIPASGSAYFNQGNVGIGTTAPATALHVVGDVTVSGNISAKYQDVAEWVPSTQALAAGTVVALDTARANHVVASASAYDTRVAGVISAQPGIALGERGEGKVLVATTGRVKIKVNAAHAPIRIGDLLVTSDVPGVAMRSEPIAVGGRQLHAPGTIIGKALESLEKGTGEILVLLSLQ